MSDTVTLRVQPFRSCEFIFMATILTYQCSNDNTVFLLDYLYYNVCEVGCHLRVPPPPFPAAVFSGRSYVFLLTGSKNNGCNVIA